MTVQEFLKKENLPIDILSGDDVSYAMIEFAKYHVKKAIKECIEEAPSGSSTDTVSYEDVKNALKDCYPLSNIK
tara:strand:- start:308 stop:529 length:222 start_codon:yes stop_codon:yes gene_type:complete